MSIMRVGGMSGPASSEMLSKLGLEFNKLGGDISNVASTLPPLLQQLQQAFSAAAGETSLPAVQKARAIVAKSIYIAVLQHAMEKAMRHEHFNIETAVNDLWTSLDSARNIAAGDGSVRPSIDVETMKLKRMIDKRSQMFDMLRGIMEKYDQSAKNVIQSMRG